MSDHDILALVSKTKLDKERIGITKDMIGTTVLFESVAAVAAPSSLNENENAQAMRLVLDFQLECLVALNQKHLNELSKQAEKAINFHKFETEWAQKKLNSDDIENDFLRNELTIILEKLERFENKEIETFNKHLSSLQTFFEHHENQWRQLIRGKKNGACPNASIEKVLRERLEQLFEVQEGSGATNIVGTAIQANVRLACHEMTNEQSGLEIVIGAVSPRPNYFLRRMDAMIRDAVARHE